jgi:hypothetical protein
MTTRRWPWLCDAESRAGYAQRFAAAAEIASSVRAMPISYEVMRDRLYVVGDDLHETAQVFAEKANKPQHEGTGRAQLDRPAKMPPSDLCDLCTSQRAAAG